MAGISNDGFSENSLLEQGHTYDFELLGETVEKSSETSFYILQDAFQNRYVIKKKFYGKYNFIKGKSIKCRVDGFTDVIAPRKLNELTVTLHQRTQQLFISNFDLLNLPGFVAIKML